MISFFFIPRLIPQVFFQNPQINCLNILFANSDKNKGYIGLKFLNNILFDNHSKVIFSRKYVDFFIGIN